jgi:poly(A) polymerase
VSASRRKLDADWLKEGAPAALLALLDRDGEEARVVGGAVRNTLIDEPVGDLDIATTATPEEVIRRVEAAGFKAVPTGIEHGTVTVVAESRPHEVTTLREDIETDGRHAKVVFGRDWRRDAERRDFTMNALSVTRDGTIHDYVGGLDDLEARRVRFIGEPKARIAEDYLRVLRFFRFHAAYGQGAPIGTAACIAARAHDGVAGSADGDVQAGGRALRCQHWRSWPKRPLDPCSPVPLLASFNNMTKLEAALDLPADPVRQLGARASFVYEDADQRAAAAANQHRLDACARWQRGWWRARPGNAEQDGCAALRGSSANASPTRSTGWSQSRVTDAAWHEACQAAGALDAARLPAQGRRLPCPGLAGNPRSEPRCAAEEAWIAVNFPTEAASIAGDRRCAVRHAQAD